MLMNFADSWSPRALLHINIISISVSIYVLALLFERLIWCLRFIRFPLFLVTLDLLTCRCVCGWMDLVLHCSISCHSVQFMMHCHDSCCLMRAGVFLVLIISFSSMSMAEKLLFSMFVDVQVMWHLLMPDPRFPLVALFTGRWLHRWMFTITPGCTFLFLMYKGTKTLSSVSAMRNWSRKLLISQYKMHKNRFSFSKRIL
jgi:hypothetical protein